MSLIIVSIVLALSIAGNVFLFLKRPSFCKPDMLLGVDTRDPQKDYYDWVFLIPTGDVPKRKHLVVEVQLKNGISPGGEFDETF